MKVADWSARTKAVELRLNQGYERPADTSKEARPERFADVGHRLDEMSYSELRAIMLAHFVENPEALEKRRRDLEAVSAAIDAGLPVEDAALLAAVETGQRLHQIAAGLGYVDPPEDPGDGGVIAPISPTDRTTYPQMVRDRHRATVLRYRDLLRAP